MHPSDIDTRFTYHPPRDDEQAATYAEIRETFRKLAHWLVSKTPSSREQSLAMTKLEEAVFWANAAVARNDG
jgi:hypothetical protein